MGRLIKIILMFLGLFMAGMVLVVPVLAQSLFFLIGTFVIIAMYLLLMGAELLALYYLIIYVGAIMVLFLFVIMMAQRMEEDNSFFKRYPYLLGILVVLTIVLADFFTKFVYSSDPEHIVSIKLIMMHSYDLLNLRSYGPHYIYLITAILFEHYGILVFLIGVLLFVTMVGAIRICFPGVIRLKRQTIAVQLERSPSKSVVTINVKPKE